MDRTEYKNTYKKNNYDQLLLVVPKGEKEKIKQTASSLGMTMSEYIHTLYCNDIQRGTSQLTEISEGLTEEQQQLLEKCQIAKKYCYMIKRMHVEIISGTNKIYTVELKKGYINDETGTNMIQCYKTSELRKVIKKSHKK